MRAELRASRKSRIATSTKVNAKKLLEKYPALRNKNVVK